MIVTLQANEAQQIAATPALLEGHLRMGGANPTGEVIDVNNRYITRNGKPWLPVMGEMHFSRYPHELWEQEIRKMKAGGIQIVATYIFWIHHEEIEGEFDWTGNRNLRKFIALCAKHQLYVLVRLGPWSHGECRNGGYPDWIYGRCALRTNDPDYLYYAKLLYEQIHQQLEQLYFKDGGPIIGLQFDNELTNNGPHLYELKKLALSIGMEAPLYTVTGWGGPGGAEIPQDEVLPLFGGYPDHPWEQHTKRLEPSLHYFFHSIRNDPGIGTDVIPVNQDGLEGDLSNIERYPNGTCELGGGVQITYHRRPIIPADDLVAMATVRIGNGCNLLGYYMYHGGINPDGKLSTMQEHNELNRLPVYSYDFQTPLSEFGYIRPSYHAMRRLHLFLASYGESLAQMTTIFPAERPASLYDNDTLRYAVRVDGNRGFLFINNYQRHTNMPSHENVQINIALPDETLTITESGVTIPSNTYMFWPFNLDMEGSLLKYATVQPLTKVNNEQEMLYLFFTAGHVAAEYRFAAHTMEQVEGTGIVVTEDKQEDALYVRVTQTQAQASTTVDHFFTFTTATGQRVKVVTLTEEQSLQVWQGELFGRERIVRCKHPIQFTPESLLLQRANAQQSASSSSESSSESVVVAEDSELAIYPPIEVGTLMVDAVEMKAQPSEVWQRFILPPTEDKEVTLQYEREDNQPLDDAIFFNLFEEEHQYGQSPEWMIKVDLQHITSRDEVILEIDFIGDVAQLYIGGKCVADQFYSGTTWQVGLSRYYEQLQAEPLILKISPLLAERDIYMEERPTEDREAQLHQVIVHIEQSQQITRSRI
ncbi:beta-galactosidase [Paenibacillus yanchengensis]|uniref:Beta-galactosidase n=1 Tax=Paenibacillus yanchengensis TaxID=2035833 RepID=A0ABW4YI25_9BACL